MPHFDRELVEAMRDALEEVMTKVIRLQQPQPENKSGAFQVGHPKYGGRQRGTRNRVGGDLRLAIVTALHETGFITKTKRGKLVATGEGGVVGFLKWLCLNEPKTAAALFARVLHPDPWGLHKGDTDKGVPVGAKDATDVDAK